MSAVAELPPTIASPAGDSAVTMKRASELRSGGYGYSVSYIQCLGWCGIGIDVAIAVSELAESVESPTGYGTISMNCASMR